MSLVDPTIVRRIAHLSRLRFTSEEETAYGQELAKILEYVAILEDLPEPADEPSEETAYTPQRSDEIRSNCEPGSTLSNAPDQQTSYFRVPVVIHDES
jgi:aspartyl-tRNA(Asn)/glutamyl-tRNA(Gln) amidotransferase subunit C